MVRFLDPEIVKMDDSFSGSRNRKNGAISGSRNRQNGRQILYVDKVPIVVLFKILEVPINVTIMILPLGWYISCLFIQKEQCHK